MQEPHTDRTAGEQARWLRSVYGDGGASVGEEELAERVGAPMRAAQGWDSVDAFRAAMAADRVDMSDVRADGDVAIIDVRTPAGLRLERVVRVDGDGRLASMTTRLAGGASMTMVSAAAWRAAHRAFDEPTLLDDTYAALLIGDASPYQVDAVRDGTHGTEGFHYRWNMAARARLAEDTLADQRASFGTRQYVVLGAGLDTFAMRNPFDDVTVFEVDTPASQRWKLDRLAQLGIAAPSGVRYIACDFEQQDFVDQLVSVGFDLHAPAVAAWLGVSYYLTAEAIRATLERVASWPSGSAIVFDYALAEDEWDPIDGFDAAGMRAVLEGVAAAGEPFLSLFHDDELAALCRSCGFDDVELLGHDDIRARYMPGRSHPTPGPDPVMKLARARVSPGRAH
jgi:methyltransferase (TIGR00027 family)